jgi:predicted TIM-barrel fold metal-dependent hydrolase
MDTWGIDRAVVSAGGMIDLDRLSTQIIEGGHVETDADNDAVLAGCGRSDGRLLPFFFGNPHTGPDRYRSQVSEFRGLEISPAVHGVPLTDERTTALVEVADEHGHPVYVVCLGRPGVGAVDLVTLAEKFPAVTFVLGHCGFIGIDTYAINKIAPVDNIATETSGSYTGIVRAALQRLGTERVLFGTEYPLQHPSVELAKLRALELSPDSWRSVMWRNAHRVLGEEMS